MKIRNALALLILSSIVPSTACNASPKNFLIGKWDATMDVCPLTFVEFTPTTETTVSKPIGPYPSETTTVKVQYNTEGKTSAYVWGAGGFTHAARYFYVDADHIRADTTTQCVYKRR